MLKNRGESGEIHCFASKKPIVSIDTQAAYRTQILKSETTLKTWHFVSFKPQTFCFGIYGSWSYQVRVQFLDDWGKGPNANGDSPLKEEAVHFSWINRKWHEIPVAVRMCKIDNTWQYHGSITNLLVKYLPDWLDLIEGSRRQIGWTSLVSILRRDLIWQNEVLNIGIILDIHVIIIRPYIISKFLCAP